ncbi:hypothetical protein BKA65DRAFT_411336 [Rhexocercosporidium sp. MPI-PUGE-AT-0058]|nr:hypothetical protein BKA65DRAFT_411336 [Rhexocercosporidium sp. MPI-PUGE-AT-0058]
MDGPTTDNVVAITRKVADYGSAIASVLTNYSISAKRIPQGFEGAINIINATIATLQQVSGHLKTETASVEDKQENQKQILNPPGLKYVQLLATECAATFAKIAPIMAEACLDRKQLKAKRKLEKKSLTKKDDLKVEIDTLRLDTAAFTEAVEKSNWIRATIPLEAVMARLHEIQLHLLIVHQVVSLGELSQINSSNQVDIKSVVAYHERILRTADLIGIKSPGRKAISSRFNRDFSSDSDSLLNYSDSDSNTDSDDSYFRSKSSKNPPFKSTMPPLPPGFRRGPPSPPPPPPAHPHARNFQLPPPHTSAQLVNWMGGPPQRATLLPAAPRLAPVTANPPAYSVAPRSANLQHPASSGSSTVQAIVARSTKPVITAPLNAPIDQLSAFPPEKETKKEKIPDVKDATTPATLEPRLFKSKSNGFSFKIKTFFRSKDSLAEEMKKALGDSDSHLRAFVLRGHETRLVPHSAFHTLEATHMRTILSQLNDNTWYKTFTTLNPVEHQTMERLIHPFVMGYMHERNVVVLKVLEENKPNAWMVLLRDLLKTHPPPYGSNDRVILAIMREKLLDGKPLPPISFGVRGLPPPPPPAGFRGPPPPPTSAFRPPPGQPNHIRATRVFDLSIPPPPLPIPSSTPFSMPGPPPRGPPPPPTIPNFHTKSLIRQSDTRPLTDHDAALALTTYTSFTLRINGLPPPPPIHHNNTPNPNPSPWSRASVTQENSPHALLHQRILSYQQKGHSIVAQKLALTDHQNQHLTRLLDELQAFEYDPAHFEWCWVEISLYNEDGELAVVSQKKSAGATVMFGVAKRALKPSCRPLEVYDNVTAGRAGPPRMPVARPPLPPPQPVIVKRGPRTPARKAKKKARYVSESSDSYSDSDSDSSLGSESAESRGKGKGRRDVGYEIDSRSGSESGSESEEDGVRIKVDLKKGDDVVDVLLDLWTVRGKGKIDV